MTIYAVLGDIHGNREALESALAAIDAQGVDQLLCVGDLVGYNADPDDCVAILRKRHALCIAGNHDLIGIGRLGFERCSNKAMHSLKRTRRRMSRETAEYLASLPSHWLLEDRFLLTHGGVRDVQMYMTKPKHILENVQYLREDFPGIRICFFGHTHEQKVFEVYCGEVFEPFASAIALPETSSVVLAPEREYFVNAGAVDASRKREYKRAQLALFDSDALSVAFLSVLYDEELTETKAECQGFRIDGWRDRLYDIQRRFSSLHGFTDIGT